MARWMTAIAIAATTIAAGAGRCGASAMGEDAWSEYPSAAAAQSDGWSTECGLSQQMIVSDDAAVGDWSLGVVTLKAYWRNEIVLTKPEDLTGLEGISFRYKASWPGKYFATWLVMEPTPEEAAAGIAAKRVQWSWPTDTAWTEFSATLDGGQWRWDDGGGMWNATGNTTPTTMRSIDFGHYTTYFGISIGDRLLLDGIRLDMAEFVLGDFDGNGALNGLDIPDFKSALADPDGWSAAHPDRPHLDRLGDFDANGAFNGLDIPGFKNALSGSATPEPSTLLLLGLGVLGARRTRR